ncbi:MAG: HU family DNA-binding protein [Halanaerobiales bacterium]|nr:HU family DNA-binding protein [Halanaerobiales bacterium]
MTKTELIDEVREKTDLTKKDTGKIINAALEAIMDYLGREAKKPEEDRDKVQIVGFGSFEVNNRAKRKGRNPQTGEEITIPERKVPVFRKGKTFKEAVDKDV